MKCIFLVDLVNMIDFLLIFFLGRLTLHDDEYPVFNDWRYHY